MKAHETVVRFGIGPLEICLLWVPWQLISLWWEQKDYQRFATRVVLLMVGVSLRWQDKYVRQLREAWFRICLERSRWLVAFWGYESLSPYRDPVTRVFLWELRTWLTGPTDVTEQRVTSWEVSYPGERQTLALVKRTDRWKRFLRPRVRHYLEWDIWYGSPPATLSLPGPAYGRAPIPDGEVPTDAEWARTLAEVEVMRRRNPELALAYRNASKEAGLAGPWPTLAVQLPPREVDLEVDYPFDYDPPSLPDDE